MVIGGAAHYLIPNSGNSHGGALQQLGLDEQKYNKLKIMSNL